MAVVVEVEQRHPEAREAPARRSQSGGRCGVDEETAVVSKKRVGLRVEVHDQQILIAVGVDIGRVDAHAGLRRAVLIDRHAVHQRRVRERAVALVHPEVVRRAVVGHEDVDAAVGIEVGRHDAQAVADRGLQPGTRRDVRERAVAAVVEQQVGGRRVVVARRAVVGHARQAVALPLGGRAPVDVARHEEIEPAVRVVIEERGARAPAGSGDAGRRRHVAKAPAPVVLEQHVPPEVRDIQVGVAVVVVIAGRDAHAVPGASAPLPLRHVVEAARRRVAEEAVAGCLLGAGF